MTTKDFTAYEELLDLLTSHPTPEEVLGFAPSDETIERARYLIEGHTAGTLTIREAGELDALAQLAVYKRIANRQAQQR